MGKMQKVIILLMLLMLVFSIQTIGVDGGYKPKVKLKVKVVHIKKVSNAQKIKYDAKTIYLARLISSEGVGESLNAKIGIGNVILNRHKQYNHNLRNVKRIVNARGQFDGKTTRLFRINPSTDCLKASYLAYKGINKVGRATHFINYTECKKNGTLPSWVHKFKFIKKINNTSFYENPDWYK